MHPYNELISVLGIMPRPCYEYLGAAGFASVEDTQHVRYQEDQQYGAQPYACTPAITPPAVAVEPSTAP